MDPFKYKSKQNRNKIIAFVFMIFLTSQLKAEETELFSIMLNEAEQLALGKALGLKKTEASDLYQEISDPESHGAILFLSAIIHFTPEKWALWLNDQVIHPKTALPGILLKEVRPDSITFTLEGEPQKKIILGLNQSYSYNQKRVIDGDVRQQNVVSIKH